MLFYQSTNANHVGRRFAIAAVAAILFLGVFLGSTPATVSGAPVVETYMTDLNVPVALAFPSDGRIFFAEIFTGNIRVVENGLLLPDPLYTLPNTAAFGETGLLGLALHPQFPTEPWIYAYQTFDDTIGGTYYNRVVRIRVTGNTGLFHEVLLDPIPAASIHNGGILGFGPEGHLYVTTGDARDFSQVPDTAQDLTSLAGKVLRMNPDGSVPADNPFVGDPNANPYVYTYGHRNPFGLTFHPATGKAYSTENGPDCNDEVNILIPGGNFGWGPSQTCDTSVLPYPQNTNQDGPSPILPIAWYTPTTAPVNAAVYTGTKFPAWQGDLVIGEFNTASLRRLDLEPPDYATPVSESVIHTAPESILEVEVGPDGAIWFTTASTIYRYTDDAQPPTASFTATPPRVNRGVPIMFDASTSSDPDGTILSYSWDFGDGFVGEGVATTHAYAVPGTYTATLTVVDNEMNSARTSRSVSVNAPPVASFSMNPARAFIGVTVAFDGAASTDPESSITLYSWDFGDGATATGPVVTHAYERRGVFTVTLTVVDDLDASDTAAAVLEVLNRPPVIVGASPAAQVSLDTNASQIFSVVAQDPESDAVTFAWEVNGVPVGSDSSSFEFRSTASGTYSVSVSVSDGSLSSSYEWTVTVGGLFSPSAIIWWIVAAILTAIAVIVLVVRLRRKR